MLIHQTTNSMGNYNYNEFTYDNCEWYYHFHKNYELIHVLSGEVEAMVDGRQELLSQGDFALILPDQIHSLHTPQQSSVWIGVFSEDYVFAFSSWTNMRVGEHARFPCDPHIGQYLTHVLMEEHTHDVLLLKSCFYAACDQYQKHVPMIPRGYEDDNLLCKIVDYVSMNFKNDIPLQRAAYELGYEYHYLSRCFHAIFRMNYCQFVNQYRVNYARELLAQRYGTIAEIALECGFQNVRSFNSAYRRLIGSAPREFYQG